MTPQPNQADAELDALVRDIMQVPYSKHKAKQKLRAWGLKQQCRPLERVAKRISLLTWGGPMGAQSSHEIVMEELAALQAQLETEEKPV